MSGVSARTRRLHKNEKNMRNYGQKSSIQWFQI